MSIETMKQALEALCVAVEPKTSKVYAREFQPIDCVVMYENAITSLRQAIAEAEGISITTIEHPIGPPADDDINPDSLEEIEIDLPKREWVGLTDEDDIDWEEGGNLKDLVKAIEAKLKEKNCA
jgi:hypothetical protein